MKFTVSVDDEQVKKWLGKNITENEFQIFCKDALTRALWKEQFRRVNKDDK